MLVGVCARWSPSRRWCARVGSRPGRAAGGARGAVTLPRQSWRGGRLRCCCSRGEATRDCSTGARAAARCAAPGRARQRAAQAEEDAGLDLHRNTVVGLDGQGRARRRDRGALEPCCRRGGRRPRAARPDAHRPPPPGRTWTASTPRCGRPTSRRRGRRVSSATPRSKSGLRTLLGNGALGVRGKAAPTSRSRSTSTSCRRCRGRCPAGPPAGVAGPASRSAGCCASRTFTRMVLDACRRVVRGQPHPADADRAGTAGPARAVGRPCAAAGCVRGPATGHRLVPHHACLFSHTGTTSLDDTVPLCEQDHHHLHDDRRLITLSRTAAGSDPTAGSDRAPRSGSGGSEGWALTCSDAPASAAVGVAGARCVR